MPRPEEPPYVPKKTGIDAETQIESDLFDFDYEVAPMLSVIVDKTLEQALLEVEEEEELRAIRERKSEMDAKLDPPIALIRRLMRMDAPEARQRLLKEKMSPKVRAPAQRAQRPPAARARATYRSFRARTSCCLQPRRVSAAPRSFTLARHAHRRSST